jgi:DNA-binding NarL/FixJ family response regulator
MLTLDPTGTVEPLRVLVVARQALARAGLRGVLGELADVTVVGLARSADEAETLARDLRPEVVLAAWDGADADAAVALVEALAAAGTPLVLLGEPPSPPDLAALVRAGLHGFVLGDATPEDVGAALRAVGHGLLVLDPILARALPALDTVARASAPPELVAEQTLTEREREVLQLLALGLPNKTIARRLGVSEHTVKFHVGSILAKLEASSRTEAVTRAARRGLLAL